MPQIKVFLSERPIKSFLFLSLLWLIWFHGVYSISDCLQFTQLPLFILRSNSFYFNDTLLLHICATIGLLLGGLSCDGKLKIKLAPHKLWSFLMFAAGLLTAARYFSIFLTGSPELVYNIYLLLSALSILCAFAAYAFLFYYLLRQIKPEHRAPVYGLSLSLIYFWRMLPDTYTSITMFASPSLEIFAACSVLGALSAGFYTIFYPSVLVFPGVAETPDTPLSPQTRGSLLLLGLLCVLVNSIFYQLYNMFTIANEQLERYILFFRLAQALSALAAAWLSLRYGRHVTLLAGVPFLGLGVLAHWFSYSGATMLIFPTMTLFGLHFFYIAARTLFTDISFYSKYPGVVSSLGLSAHHFFQAPGLFAYRFLAAHDKETAFLLYIGLFILYVPLPALFFTFLRNAHAQRKEILILSSEPATETAFTQTKETFHTLLENIGLTKREKEIFPLLLNQLSTYEIAQSLFISESTARWHVANIFKKAGVESRIKLIDEYRRKMSGNH